MDFSNIEGIDLFSGVGGLSLGARRAGIAVTHAIEANPSAAAAYRLNHPETRLIEADIRTVKTISLSSRRVRILFGGPPCQGFSTANQRTRDSDNSLNWLYREFFRIARILKPQWIVFENVKGLRETAKGKFFRSIGHEFQRLCYDFTVWDLNAVDFGVPQIRSRLFFVARKKGKIPQPPKHLNSVHVTVRDAIADLPRLKIGAAVDLLAYSGKPPSTYAKSLRKKLRKCTGNLVTANNDLVLSRYKHIPPGGNWCDIPRALMRNYTNLVDHRSRHTGIYRRLAWETPSIVIANYRKNMLIHPEQNRGLSVREAARIQSFPDNFQFAGTIGLQQQQVSNAVPPLLSKAVFQHIVAHC